MMSERMSTYRLLFELGRAGVSDYADTSVLMRSAILEGLHKFTIDSTEFALHYLPDGAGPEFWELRQGA